MQEEGLRFNLELCSTSFRDDLSEGFTGHPITVPPELRGFEPYYRDRTFTGWIHVSLSGHANFPAL